MTDINFSINVADKREEIKEVYSREGLQHKPNVALITPVS